MLYTVHGVPTQYLERKCTHKSNSAAEPKILQDRPGQISQMCGILVDIGIATPSVGLMFATSSVGSCVSL